MTISAAIRVGCLCAALAGAAAARALGAQQPQSLASQTPSSPEQLEATARQLGDADARVRDAAGDALREAGPAAEAALRAVAESGDREAARRAKRLLQELRQPAPEEVPPDEPAELQAYRVADRQTKLRIVREDLDADVEDGGYRAGVLARLWAEEPEEQLRAAIFAAMLRAPAASAGALVAGGNAPAAERLLEAALAQEDGTDAAAVAPYAALALLRGRLDQTITHWAGRAARGGDNDARNDGKNGEVNENEDRDNATPAAVLAHLHRANGDPHRVAAAHARAAGDSGLALQALLDARDWDAAAAQALRPRPPARPESLGELALLAGVRRAAGDDAALRDAVRRLIRLADADSAERVARALLFVGRPDDALRVMADNDRWLAHFKTLEVQDRPVEAMEFVRSKDADQTEEALLLRVAGAGQLHELGEPADAAALLDRVVKENKAVKSARVAAAMGTAARRMEMPAQAWQHFRDAARLEAAQEDGEAGYALYRASQVEDVEVDGAVLWQMLARFYPADTIDQRFARVESVFDRKMPLDELKDLAGALDDEGKKTGTHAYAAHLFREAGQRMRVAGDRAGAEQYVLDAIPNAPAPSYAAELYQRLGDWAEEDREWGKAATCYARAWNADRTAPTPLYLRAWAMRQGGWHARAGELFNLAYVLPLADAPRRLEAMEALHERGLMAGLAREADVIRRTARPDRGLDLQACNVAHQYDAELALRTGDPLAAAAAHERMVLNSLALIDTYGFVEQVFYVRLPHTAGRLRAKGLLARGEVAAAERAIAVCRALAPNDVMLAIDVVPEFERLGNKARADELYAEAMAAQEAVLETYPQSAGHHNSLAWLAVMCGRDSDKALEHARQAVALRPANTAARDTLAEALFRRGEIDEAIKEMSRCAELEPKVARHREQLDRFEAAKRGEQRPMPPG